MALPWILQPVTKREGRGVHAGYRDAVLTEQEPESSWCLEVVAEVKSKAVGGPPSC
ncbi:MAG: hypothetical protein ACODAD_15920 [Planctomycetota bacterium]